jgi:transcriptional regulator with XRE-family HTH domain
MNKEAFSMPPRKSIKPATTPKPAKKAGRSTRGRLADGSANPIDVHVGARIRLRRTLLGMSQERLGECLGLTFQQVQKYERGANRVGASRLFDLSRVLDVRVGYFFEDIPDAAQAASPVEVIKGKVTSAIEVADDNPMTKRETLELVRAYFSINDPKVREQVLAMAKALGPR